MSDPVPTATPCPMCNQAGECTDLCFGTGEGQDAQQTTSAPAYCDPDADLVACPNCGGEGGYPYCGEDSCPCEGGEDCCDDPVCWRVCDWCKGKG